ncbi:protein NDNF isoform X1 [Lepisosteus oculatus]|nr:PREDICTED: protein NDNF-like isoform X1 [Lepisosteus oculatus]
MFKDPFLTDAEVSQQAAGMAVYAHCYLILALLCGPVWPVGPPALLSENEVPLRPSVLLSRGKLTPIRLPKDQLRRLYFTLQKGSPAFSVAVSPCDVPIEWSLTVRMLQSKPATPLHWGEKKSMAEVWWRSSGAEKLLHTYKGNAMDTYSIPPHTQASFYILKLRSVEQDTRISVYLQDGGGSLEAFPQLPPDPRIRIVGLGMTSVTLSWSPSPSALGHGQQRYHYCVLANRRHNYKSMCAVQEAMRKEKMKMGGKQKAAPRPFLKQEWWNFPKSGQRSSSPLQSESLAVLHVCTGTETVYTVSELSPDTQYYFDVFVVDQLNGTSVAYTGTFAHTHQEPRPPVQPLGEGELRWVTVRGGGRPGEHLSFRPRGWQQSALLTLQKCGAGKVRATITSKADQLASQELSEEVTQIWVQGKPTYVIHLETAPPGGPAVSGQWGTAVKIQASSAYHRQAAPLLPASLQIKSFNKLRSCHSVTLAWLGTEERSLYCVYRHKLEQGEGGDTGRCIGPESRSDVEKVLCKYFQELNPRRAVTTATIGGLEPGMAYLFDVYLMRPWGIPVKYLSKVVRTRREC